MVTVIEAILARHKLLETFRDNGNFFVRVSVSGFMPLSIERHGDQVFIAHYFVQNGDLIPDPDMEFEIVDGRWVPAAIQHSSGAYRRCVTYANGNRLVDLRQQRDQAAFSDLWAQNLLSQGFAGPHSHVTTT